MPRLCLRRTILLFSPDLKFPTITMTTNDTGVYSQIGLDGLLCFMLESATSFKDYPLSTHYIIGIIVLRISILVWEQIILSTRKFLSRNISFNQMANLFTAHCEKFVSFKTLSLTSEWMFTTSFTVQFHRVVVQLEVFLTLERNQNVWTSNITQIFMWLKQIFNVKIFVYC